MKTYVAALSILFSTLASAHCGTGSMPVGFHEFGIFGGSKHVFVSHYPAFSSIHAYQVLLEVELSADGHDAQTKFLEHQAAHPNVSYTYSPYRKTPVTADRVKDQDDWVLPEKAAVGQVMNGDIHYDDNNADTTLDFNVSATIVRVIQRRLLNPGENNPKQLTYIAFGDANGYFLAHYLSAPANPGAKTPDFDQILAISTATPATPGTIFTVSDRANEQKARLVSGDSATLTDGNGGKLDAKVLSEIFVHKVGTER